MSFSYHNIHSKAHLWLAWRQQAVGVVSEGIRSLARFIHVFLQQLLQGFLFLVQPTQRVEQIQAGDPQGFHMIGASIRCGSEQGSR